MDSDEATYRDVAASDEVPEGEGRPFTVAGRDLAIVRCEGKLHALDDRCPHAEAAIALGTVAEGRIVCPWHHAEFDLDSGEPQCGPAVEKIPVHRIRERDGRIEVSLADETE